MFRIAIFFFLLSGLLTCGASCNTSVNEEQLQLRDTVITVFGRRVLVPLGAEQPYMNININGPVEHPYPRPSHYNGPGLDRQVVFSEVRLNGVVGGEETAEAYLHALRTEVSGLRYTKIEDGKSANGLYAIICEWCSDENYAPRYTLYWFAPNDDYALQVLYTMESKAFEQLGGLAELRGFANQVRLLPN